MEKTEILTQKSFQKDIDLYVDKLAILCSTCTKSIKAQNSTFFQI